MDEIPVSSVSGASVIHLKMWFVTVVFLKDLTEHQQNNLLFSNPTADKDYKEHVLESA